ncbi:MAG: hypothetical protein Q9175_006446 [Cornicularia normoerica]
MPPSRRSQGDPPPPSTPPAVRPSKRQKKDSARAKEINKAREDDAARNKSLTPAYSGGGPGSRARYFERQSALAESQKRRTEAADRVRAQKQREQEAWEAEVAEFGEEEAKRRRREEKESRLIMNELPTSEVEEMELEDKISNPMLEIWSFEEQLNGVIQKRDGHIKGWTVERYSISIRADAPKATRFIQTIDDLSEAEWAKAEEAIVAQAVKWEAEQVNVRIELTGKADKTLPKPAAGSAEEPITIDRLTRTDKLLDRARVKADVLKAAGNFDKELLDHWQCHDTRCRNHDGWCFVDYSGQHYDMDHTQQSAWSKAIANGEDNVSVYRPPTRLYEFWTKTQGVVTSHSRRSLQKQDQDQERKEAKTYRAESKVHREESVDYMQQLAALHKQQMDMQMAESMAESMQRMTSRRDRQEQQREQRELQQQYQQPPSHPMYQAPAFAPRSMLQGHPSPTPQGYPYAPPAAPPYVPSIHQLYTLQLP